MVVHINRLIVVLTVAIVAVLAFGDVANAGVLINIDKSVQRMTVAVDGKQLYDWPVSTGGSGYDTPNGTFKPFRMEIDHYSQEWDDAPMPYSIFFTKIGHAIHGTNQQRNLGHPVSHGCVRLSVKNAATLWELVKGEKMANTTVVLSGVIPDVESPSVARSRPIPLTADDPRYAAPPPQYQRRYDGYGPPAVAQSPHDYYDPDEPLDVPSRPQYTPREQNDRLLLPFPSLFGR